MVIVEIFYRDSRSVKYLFGMDKIKAVLFQIDIALGFSPCEFHGSSYTYVNIYYKSFECTGGGSITRKLMGRRNPNVAAVALANKNARIGWALLAHGRTFHPDYKLVQTTNS